ncbi:MAG: T9SS type A sorting domain-containing protein [Bacteroidota bacterium]
MQHFKNLQLLSLGIIFLNLFFNLSFLSAQSFSPGVHTVTVPNGTVEMEIKARGADGGDFEAKSNTEGGQGATVTATFSVSGGNVLTIIVGSKGQNRCGTCRGFNGSAGGGGGSGISLNGQVLVIAGGGGGSNDFGLVGSGGQGFTGSGQGGNVSVAAGSDSGGGGGGLLSSGGDAPGGSRAGGGGQVNVTGLSSGGVRNTFLSTSGDGGSGFGGGGGGGKFNDGGGGGGGYTGGSAGGGGGSSFVAASASSASAIPGSSGGGTGLNGSVAIVFHASTDDCPNDPAKKRPGFCGCGTPDTDTDEDGLPDCVDGCPFNFFKTSPGACGCDQQETDSDGDGTPDCIDGCPKDPNKIKSGCLGCGVADIDKDGDGKVDCEDSCPDNYNPSQQLAGDCDCEAPKIMSVEVINISACDPSGEEKDIFTADVQVTFTDPPTLGAVNITGDINEGKFPERINFDNGSRQSVFIVKNRPFKANGQPINIRAAYIGNEGCGMSVANAGMAPEGCVELNDLPVVIGTREVDNYCELIMKDSGIYKLVTWINNDSANTVKVQIIQTDAEKTLIILQNLQNANGKLQGFIQKLNLDKTINLGIANPRTTPKMKGRWSPPLRIDYQPNEGDACIGIPPVKFIECNDNGTSDPDDDYLIFDMTVVGEKDKTYDLSGGIIPSKGGFNTLSSFRAPAGSALGDMFSFMVTTTDDTTCEIEVNLPNPGFCSDVCRITDISLGNFQRCQDFGSVNPTDDIFMADITVSFKNPPNRGFLNLDAVAMFTSEANFQTVFDDAVRVSRINSSNTYVFENVTIPEGADTYELYASFSADDCEFALTDYYIPNVPCFTLRSCPPISDLTVNLDEAAQNTVLFDWPYLENALLQTVEIRVPGLPWQTIANDSSDARIVALLPNTTYEYRLRYYCQENAWSEYNIGTFTTGDSPLDQDGLATETENLNARLLDNIRKLDAFDGKKLHLFPNPVRNQLTVFYDFSTLSSNNNEPVILRIFDLLGRQVHQIPFEQSDGFLHVNMELLPKGVYQLQLNRGKERVTRKFVKS